jgi:hypothetical protein
LVAQSVDIFIESVVSTSSIADFVARGIVSIPVSAALAIASNYLVFATADRVTRWAPSAVMGDFSQGLYW